MLIGIDASRTVTGRRTGTENYALQLTRRLIQLDRSNRYRLYYNQAPPPGLFARQQNVEERIISFPRLWTHACLSVEMLRRPPDVLFVPAHVLPLHHPPRTVVTVHDLGYLYFPEAHKAWSRRYLDWSTRFNARQATAVIADSEATRRDLIAHYHIDPHKITVIYPGIGDEFRPITEDDLVAQARARYDLPATYLLYVGTLQPRKNLVRLISAYHQLCQQYPPALLPHLVIAGKKGWLYDEILAQATDLRVSQRVRFPGYVDQQDLPALLGGASALLMPSLYEGFGLPVLEAMACGTPVICSNTSSLPEVAGDAALLVDPLDVQGLVDAMAKLLSDDALRQDLVRRGFAQAARFSWAETARQALAVCERAAG